MTKFDKDFKEWYHKNYTNIDCYLTVKYEVFYELPIEMQFGVYQLFADSVGVDMNIEPINGTFVIGLYINDHVVEEMDSLEDRLKAIKELLEMFINYYNKIK